MRVVSEICSARREIVINSIHGSPFPAGWTAARLNEWLLRSCDGEIGLLARIPFGEEQPIEVMANEERVRQQIHAIARRIRMAEYLARQIHLVMDDPGVIVPETGLPRGWSFREKNKWFLTCPTLKYPVLAMFDIDNIPGTVLAVEDSAARSFLMGLLADFRKEKLRERKIMMALAGWRKPVMTARRLE